MIASRLLGDIARIGAGNSAPQGDHLFEGGEFPFFRTSDVGRIRFGKISVAADNLNESGIRGLRVFPAGTILFPKSGASTFLNHRVTMEVDGYVSSHLATIVANEFQVLPQYLLYFLSTVAAQDMVQDHAYPSLNLPVIAGIHVPLPAMQEQQRIVAILDEAFAGIATAKANAEKSLRNAVNLFDDKLRKLFSSGTWPKKSISEACIEIFAGGDVPQGNHSKEPSEKYQVPIYTNGEKNKGLYGYTDRPRVTSPSLTISARGTIGYTEIRNESYYPAIRLVVVIPDTTILDLGYLYYAVKAIDISHSGTSIPQLTVPMVREFLISVPPLAKQREISQQLDTLQSEIFKLQSIYTRKITVLGEIKKSLMHQVFSGQL